MSDSTFRTTPDEEWEDLMRQLRNQPQAQPRPFFYNRLSARLAQPGKNQHRTLPLWMLRPAYAALLGVIMLALSGDARALRPGMDATTQQTLPTSDSR